MKRTNGFGETLTGVFMAAVMLLLAYFTIVISGMDIMLGKEKTAVSVKFPDVGGLKARDSVMYRGMKVGTVDSMRLNGDSVVIEMLVDPAVKLREGYRISVGSLSLLGGNYLLLEEGTGAEIKLAGATLKGERPCDWMRDIGKIADSVSAITGDGQIRSAISNINQVAEKLNVIVARVERGEGTVGKLFSSDEEVYDDLKSTVKEAKAAFADVKAAFANVKGAIDEAKAGFGEMKGAFASVKEVSDEVKNSEGLVSKLVKDRQMAEDAGKLVANLNAASDDLKAVAEKLAKGEGTLGKLAADQALYDEVTALIRDLRQIVDNYRDSTPISSFGSLIGGAL